MLFSFVFLLLAVNASVVPRALTDCGDGIENIEMSVWNDGPSVTGDAGIGAEFETPFFNFQNSACSLEDTFAAKRMVIQGRSGQNFVLSVDTGSTELGAGKLNPEYILDGTSIKVGDGSAAAAGAAATNDLVSASLLVITLQTVSNIVRWVGHRGLRALQTKSRFSITHNVILGLSPV